MRLRPTLIFTLSGLITLALLWVGCILLIAPLIIKSRLEKAVKESCETCEIEIPHLRTHVFSPGLLSFSHMRIRAGHKGGQRVDAQIEHINLSISVRRLLDHQLVIESLNVEEPRVTFTDGDKPAAKVENSPKESGEFIFALRHSYLSNGVFTYIRDYKKTHAVLHIHNIAADIGEVGNSRELNSAITVLKISGQIEKSGKVELQIKARLLKAPLHVDLKADMNGQDLGDLTPFFKHNDGVNLSGILLRGHTEVTMRDRQATAWVWAEYKDFKIVLDKTAERTLTTAFFMNLGTAIAIGKKDLGKPTRDQLRTVEVKREAEESIVSFALRGIKEAALKVSMAP